MADLDHLRVIYCTLSHHVVRTAVVPGLCWARARYGEDICSLSTVAWEQTITTATCIAFVSETTLLQQNKHEVYAARVGLSGSTSSN